MLNLKKELMELAKSIQYADMYDLTTVPNLLRRAADKIEDLELENIDLKEQIERSKMKAPEVQMVTTNSLYLSTSLDRELIKSQLIELNVSFSNKDNTQRLLNKLQKALQE